LVLTFAGQGEKQTKTIDLKQRCPENSISTLETVVSKTEKSHMDTLSKDSKVTALKYIEIIEKNIQFWLNPLI
jgi:hypothetical protein